MDRPDLADPLPGQLYAWAFAVGDGGWIVEAVTEERRHTSFGGRHTFIRRGDTFTVVSTNDPGPEPVPDYGGLTSPSFAPKPRKRWHVVLLRDTLVWFEHEWLRESKLVT